MALKALFGLLILLLPFAEDSDALKLYQRDYYQNGKLKSEGWLRMGEKSDYWKYYHPNGAIAQKGHYKNNQRADYWYFYEEDGKISSEGHYKNGKKADWWLFYDENGLVIHKCQLSDGKKDGYCLKYKDEKLRSAVKYSNGKRIKEWYTFSSFKKENKLSDLK